ncbi:putative YkwD family protein [Aquisalibacillus elongatus]|uniref:Putative YkwD family protein n=1 Tax=Aquisalibacillus elongatus TaxID=485577 RepID=A0A3N5C5D4_9BACI|nr:putative YkwD family protein [Aquisalibacillus elongatus]
MRLLSSLMILVLVVPMFFQSEVSAQSPEQKVAELTNAERQERGRKPLTYSAELSKVAEAKAKDMYNNNYFSHTSPTYGSPFDMMKQFGISYRTAGENIAKGQPSASAVVQDWMNSSGHRRNILSPDFNRIGVGYYQGYWVQMFVYSTSKLQTDEAQPAPKEDSYDPSPKRPSWQYYTVKKGDTAWEIAINNWVSLRQLKILNPKIQDLGQLKVGQQIRVSGNQYEVKPGDSAWGIARKHGMKLWELRELNPQDENLNTLYVGQGLFVR